MSSMLSGKKGYVIIHVGSGKDRLKPLFDAVENSELPADTFLPTHCCRTAALISDAVKFNQMGGTADFTADTVESENGTAAAVYSALQQGANPARITMSSDACGSQPKFDANGSCIGITYTTPETLLCELRRLKEIYGVPFETALAFFTEIRRAWRALPAKGRYPRGRRCGHNGAWRRLPRGQTVCPRQAVC